MVQGMQSIGHRIEAINKNVTKITISIPARFVNTVYTEVLLAQKSDAHTPGFPAGKASLAYIEQNYRSTILDHVSEFLIKFFVIQQLYHLIRQEKIFFAGDPRLTEIHVKPNEDASFSFEVTMTAPIDTHKWKSLPFKAPGRKNYKDIDRQVESFIKEEETNLEKARQAIVEVHDWVGFDVQLLNGENKPCFDSYKERLWLKIGAEEADLPFQELFVGKKIGDAFTTNHPYLQDFFGKHVNTKFMFSVTITAIVKHTYFCLDLLKKHFRIKSNKDVHKKLIEIFSYRNDLSLRRSMAEEALKVLISKHSVEAPNHLVLRQQKKVHDSVCANPDYQVYKTEANFEYNLRKLAEKQIKELLIIDQLALQENLEATDEDIMSYLNLLKRPRTKEFLYFIVPDSKENGQECPINNAVMEHCCLREKTLNHIIYHLTKK
jgi:trigger factor